MKHTLICCFFATLSFSTFGQSLKTQTNLVVEWSYYSDKEYEDPFNQVDLSAEIIDSEGKKQILPAFWAGENKWSFRYSSSREGEFTFTTFCSDSKNKELHKQKGKISIIKYKGTNELLHRGPLQIASDKRHLQHNNGTPFLWLADSWWHGMTSRFKWPEDFTQLTQDRKDKGFSVIQFAIAFPCDIAPFDSRGMNEAGNPWDENWKSIRPEYFDLVDLRVQHLVDQGLVPNIVGAWGYYIKFAGAEVMKKHWEYLIARYGAYPVSYTLCGESTLAWYPDLLVRWAEEKKVFRKEWSKVAKHIQKNDPYDHILTVHPGPNSGDFLPIDSMEYIDMVMLQSGHNGYFTLERASKGVDKAMKLYSEKPIMHGEVCFEGMGGKSLADVQRYLFWSDMLKGTAGFSYGVEGIWQFNTEEELFGVSPGGNTWGNVPWEKAYQYDGSKHVGVGRKILLQLEWQHLKPAPGRIEEPSDDLLSRPVCAELPGDKLLVYLFKKPSRWANYKFNGFEANLEINLTFLDPLTGDEYKGWNLIADEKGVIQIEAAPIMQDWIVLIEN